MSEDMTFTEKPLRVLAPGALPPAISTMELLNLITVSYGDEKMSLAQYIEYTNPVIIFGFHTTQDKDTE